MKLGTLGLVKISDLKTIDVVELQLKKDGQFVALEGDNGVGKSTVMDAISLLFTGGKVPDGLIRNGKKEASIEAAFSEGYSVKRRIRTTKKGEQVVELTLTDPTGAPVTAPGAILKNLFGGFVTPAKLAASSGAALYGEVSRFLPVDLDEMEAGLKILKDHLSEARAERSVLGNRAAPAAPRPELPTFDEAAFIKATDALSSMKEAAVRADAAEREITQIQEEIESLQARLRDRSAYLEEIQNDIASLTTQESQVIAMREARDARVEKAGLISEWDAFEKWQQDYQLADSRFTNAGKVVAEKAEEIRKALSEAVGPGGVKVNEDRTVMIGDVPWENCAFSERVKAAALLQLAGLEEGKLPLVFIEHGESMNSEKRMEVAKAAVEAGATVFMEIMKEETKELTIRYEGIPEEWADNEHGSVGPVGSMNPPANLQTTDEALEEYKTPTQKKPVPPPQIPPPPGSSSLGVTPPKGTKQSNGYTPPAPPTGYAADEELELF